MESQARHGSRPSATASSRSRRPCSSSRSASTSGDGHDLGSALLHLWPSYLAYATSFITIGIIWINHHHCVETDRARRPHVPLPQPAAAARSSRSSRSRRSSSRDYLQKPGEQDAVLAYAATFVADGGRSTTSGGATRARSRRLIARQTCPTRACARSTARSTPACRSTRSRSLVAFFSPLASVFLTFAIAAFYLPSAALFER